MVKRKYILISVGLLLCVVSGVVFFYKLDPSLLTKLSFYVDLANPSVKVVRVQEGLRKEQVADVVGEKLGWDESQKEDFLKINLAYDTVDLEGHYFPKTYLIDKDESPTNVSVTMIDEFTKQIDKIQQSQNKSKDKKGNKIESEQIINEDTALIIASIIEREAGGKSDMQLISGIIWNRIFSGMKLQIDATLQYAKGTEEEGWWGKVAPADKKIDSDYNTYLNAGLPPGAISNPGPDALYAAYNPQKTDCLFYLHDKNRKIHCAKTYEEHLNNIKKYY